MSKGIKFAPTVADTMGIAIPLPRGPQVPPPEPGSYKYTVVSSMDLNLAGASYPFLDKLLQEEGRHWTIIQQDLKLLDEEIHPYFTFGMEGPTFQVVDADGLYSLYVDGVPDEEAFTQKTGVELDSSEKGEFVKTKRVKRSILRPYYVHGFFEDNQASIYYLEPEDYAKLTGLDPAKGPKLFDGAAVISREMLMKMQLSEDIPAGKRAYLEKQLLKARRVELTIQHDQGQDKAHAMVADEIVIDGKRYDFILPKDTKGEVKFRSTDAGELKGTSRLRWVGVDFPHGKEHMRIDIQSVINLNGFFTPEQYAEWLHDAGEVYARAVESGDVVAAMSRIDSHETLDDVESYGTRLYFASGGHPMHSAHHARSLMRQRLEQLNHNQLDKLRIEIPGCRMYMMSAAVGRAAGYAGMDFAQGEVFIDKDRDTIWINDDDWEQASKRCGGADQDDAAWIHIFKDEQTGENQVLYWRSPNQHGEYMLAKPAIGSFIPTWETANGDILTEPPTNNSQNLPLPIDERNYRYTHISEKTPPPFTLKDAIERAQENSGSLGMACNTHMLLVALYGDLPEEMPAPLEVAVDSQVKDGRPTWFMKEWAINITRGILKSRTPIPRILIGNQDKAIKSRLSYPPKPTEPDTPRERLPPPVATRDHWLDRVQAAVMAEARRTEARMEELAGRALPPRAVFDAVFGDTRAIKWGAEYNSLYAKTAKGQGFDRAREVCEAYLDGFTEQDQHRVVLGAMYNFSLSSDESGKVRSDASVWQKGVRDPQTGKRLRGIEHRTIQALRSIGVLDEIAETENGLVAYPGAVISEPPVKTIGLSDAWLYRYKQVAQAAGHSIPSGTRAEQMGSIPKEQRDFYKAEIARFARTSLRDRVFKVGADETGQLAAFREDGVPVATIVHADDVKPGDSIQIHHSRATDGNLRSTYTNLGREEPGQGDQ